MESFTAAEVAAILRAKDEMTPVLQKASAEAKNFGAEVMSAFKRVESSSYETTKAANELHRSLLEAFESPTAALKNYAHSIESELIGSFGAASIAAAAFAGVVGGSALALFELADSAAHTGSELKDMAVKAGVSVETMGALKYVAGALGESAEGLANSMFIMSKNIESGSAGAQKGIQALGLSWQDFSAMKPDEQMLAMSDAMRSLPPEVNKSTIAFEIFGRQGREMLPKLLEPMRELYEQGKLNNKWTDESVEKSKQFEVALNTLKMQISNVATAIGRDLIEQVLKWIEVAKSSKFVTEGLPAIAHAVAEGFKFILAAAEKLVAIGNYLIDKWNNLPPVLKNVAETAALTAAGLWALNTASNAMTGSSGGVVETLGGVLQTAANLSQTFGTSLPKAIASTVESLKILKLILIEDGIAAAGLSVIGAVFTSTAALVGALGVAAVAGAVGLQEFVASAVAGEGGLKGLQDAITNTLDPMKKLGEAAKNTGKDIQLTADGLSAYQRAVRSGTLDIYAQALANNIADDAQKRLSADLGRFSEETLTKQTRKLIENKAEFDAWAKEVHLSAEAIAFLTKAGQGSIETLSKLGAMHDTVQKDMIESTKRGVDARIALAQVEGAAAIRQLTEQFTSGKMFAADYYAQREAQEKVNAANIQKIRSDANRAIADEVEKLNQDTLSTILKANKDEMAGIQATADFEIAQKQKEYGSVEAFEKLKTAVLANATAKRIELYRKEYDTAIAGIAEVAAKNAEASKQNFEDAEAAQREHENYVIRVNEGQFALQRKQVQDTLDDIRKKLAERGGDWSAYWEAAKVSAVDKLNEIQSAEDEFYRNEADKSKQTLPLFDQTWTAVNALSTAFTQLGQAAGGSLGTILSGMGQMVVMLNASHQATQQFGLNNEKLGGDWGYGSVMFNDQATKAQKAAAGIAAAAAIAQGVMSIKDATESHKTAGGNALGGAMAGAQAGAAFGPWGIAIGAAAGLVVGLIRGKPDWAKAADEVGRDFGVKISDALAKEIAALAKSDFGGSRQAAGIAELGKIIQEAGGLTDKNLPQMMARFHDVFSMIETHQFTVAQGTKVIDENWQAFAAAATDADGRISASLKEIIALNERFGTQSKEIAKWQLQQGANALDGFNAIVAGTSDAVAGYDNLKKAVDDTAKANAAISGDAFTQVIANMGEKEQKALKEGMTGFKGTAEQFLSQQATLYQSAQEGDPRLKTWLSGDTMSAVRSAGDIFTKTIANMGKEEKAALLAGMDGFKGTAEEFLAQQAALYQHAQEGDSRLKTWLSGETLAAIKASEAGQKYVDALVDQQKAAEAAKQELGDLGIQAIATFSAAVAAGMSEVDALAKIHPALQMLEKSYEDLGLSVDDVALKTLMLRDKVATAAPQLMSAIGGLNQEMIALDNLGLMNVDTFGAIQRTGMEMYTRLQAQVASVGGTTVDALGPMQGYLHQALIEAENLGVPVDAFTQMLINQSKDFGIWKDKGKSATDIMIGAMQTLVDKVQDLIDTLNHVPTKIHTDVEVNRTGNGFDTGSPENPERMASGGSGRTNGPTWFYSAGNEDFWFGGEGRQAASPPNNGGGMTIKVDAKFDLQAIDRNDVAKFIEREAMPRIVEQLEDQVRDYVPRINRALGAT